MTTAIQPKVSRQFGYTTQLTDEIVEYYDSIGPREGDVAIAFTLAGSPKAANVLEVGCGIGRDATAIMRYTPHYIGIEESQDLVRLANQRVPNGTFSYSDFISYDYPKQAFDIVFAMASLRYFKRQDMTTILRNIHASLKPGGILYVSLNYGHNYKEEKRMGKFGQRNIVLYNSEVMQQLAGPGYKKVMENTEQILGYKWFEIALQRTD